MGGAATVRGWANDVKRFADDWPAQGGKVLATAVESQLRADTGDGGLSHGRKMGRATVEVDASAGEATVTGAGSRGVWTITESGTSAHTVTGKGARGVLRTPFGPRRSVRVSGAAGKQTWTSGVTRGMVAVAADGDRAWAEVGH